ncbi:hypothetical protein GCM10022254_46740 [Actinomadura meridiana]|uniref:HTH luxR-type domain-containing protein n=1 Tax=Actinomadura meridiana TaxID=559626 RepID=A0ABP8CB19_9ACTN
MKTTGAAIERGEGAELAELFFGGMVSPAGYLGTAPTALLGRAGDLERLDDVLAAPDARLVTVTGPAGVGKSRLVMESFGRPESGGTAEVLDFGQVADVPAFRLVLRRLREQCHENSPLVRGVLDRVEAGGHTVVFDHYEDVAEDLAPLLAKFRQCCPRLRMVAVGTTRLGLYGERVVRLRPLPTGDTIEDDLDAVARVPAVELFVECARSVRPDFAFTAENARFVLALVRLAGGLPFAIELAASQVTLAEPELILERFERGPGEPHRIDRHPYSRHSSVGDLVSWTFARLRADERMLLNHLAIFEGPFTTRAAAEVVGGFDGATYRTMERLFDKSVLVPGERRHGELILAIPNGVRLAAARSLARLPVHPTLRRAHGVYFRTAAAARQPSGTGRPSLDLRADLLAAFDYWREAAEGNAMAVIANALAVQSTGTTRAGQYLRLAEEALRTGVDDLRLHARTLETAGDLALRLGSAAAHGHLEKARDAYRTVDDDGAVRCLALLGDAAYAAGDLDVARRRFEEGLAVLAAQSCDQADPESAAAMRPRLTRQLAATLREAGDLSGANKLAGAALAAELGREDGDGAAIARYVLASVRWLDRDSADARALFADAAGRLGGLPDAPERPECLELLAITLWKWHRVGDWSLLVAALGLADRLRRRLGPRRPRPLGELIMPVLAAASQRLTAADYARARHSGDGLTWEEALRLVPDEDPPAGATGPAVPADVSAVLTKRELEVALLVAEGLTNRVIARRLGIAEWTVVNHLRKVMRKLGCQSRVQVTRRLSAW